MHTDIRRLLGWSSVGQMGLAACAFGLGGAAANLAGLLLMAGHALVKSALFLGLDEASRIRGGRTLAGVSGLAASHPALGWGLALGIAAIAGLPPFLIFAGQFGLLIEVARDLPWLAPPLGLGMVVTMAALVAVIRSLCLGPPGPDAVPARGVPVAPGTTGALHLHLALALLLGLAMPAPLAAMLAEAARLLG
jgi:hydrogenase-4 component F